MPDYTTDRLRNVVLLSHGGAGKTMLTEAMLYAAGVITRMGRTEDGSTVSDFEPEEAKRQASIQLALAPTPWRDHKVNIIDTPGYADFRGEVIAALRVADAAVIVVSAPAGVEVGTEQMWQMAEERGLPRLLFVNKMDREHADLQRVLASINEAFGRQCVPLQLPVGAEAQFSGVVDLLDPDAQVPEELQEMAEEARERITEAVAETDDDLATKYLEGEPLTEEELLGGLKKGVASGEIVPVLFGAATAGIGADKLLDAIVRFLPSPAEVGPATAVDQNTQEEVSLPCDSQGPLAALVFKTTADPFVGKLSLFRVYSGTFKSDTQVWNANRGQAERIAQVFVLRGKSQEAVPELAAGDIGAVAKLSVTLSGHTLTSREQPLTLPWTEFPPVYYSMAVYPKSKSDLDKMTGALSRMAEEDPSLKVHRDPDTLELLMTGLGDTHLEVAVEKIMRKFGVELVLQTPKVAYKETISTTTRVEYKHKKQTGGHGQYGHVFLELEPLPRGTGFEFAERVVGGAVPREYIPSVEKGVRNALKEGVIAGFPVVDIKATLYDGSYHPVDSSGICFEIAGAHALTKGVKEANPVLLEPIMRVKITVPDSYTGDIIGDLNSKRGRILGMNPAGRGYTEIEAEVPLAELLKYPTELRSMTQDRGSFTMEFDHYEEVPQHLVPRIVEETRAREEARV